MKEDLLDKEIMDYIDGVTVEATNEEAYAEAKHLIKMISELKEIPLQNVRPEADERFYRFIDKKIENVKSVSTLKRLLPYIIAAASVIVLFFVFPNNKGFEVDYRALNSNPEKLSFIYNLNEQQLSTKDIEWLKTELTDNISPNIKVTIVDLLTNYQTKLDIEFYNNLQYESTPSVQMALLNTLENSESDDFTNELVAFSQRRDLDNTVRQKAKQILSNQ